MDRSDLPALMVEANRWVLYRLKQQNGRTLKIPFQVGNPEAKASSTVPSTWASFDRAIETLPFSGAEGVGFVLGDGFVGVDLDACLDDAGKLSPWASHTLARLPKSFTEISPSGRGLHLYAIGQLDGRGVKHRGIEVYSRNRYFTVTAQRYSEAPLELSEATTELTALVRELGDRSGDTPDRDTWPEIELQADAEPPAPRLAVLLEDKKARTTWEEKRRNLGDSTPSGYDLAFASLAARAGWSAQEIADALIARRRLHGHDLHLDNPQKYRRTLAIALDGIPTKTNMARARVVTGAVTDGARLLDEVEHFLGRFVAYPSEAARMANTLWIAHAHMMDAWESTPRIAFLSPEPASGKTRALEVTETLVPNPVEAVNVTPAYLFRKVGEDPNQPPTILFDETDTVFGFRARNREGNEEIRGLLNAGHRRGAVAGRCVVHGKKVLTEEIPAYCAVALAGLGDLPDTLLSRAVVIRMRRRAPGESIEPYRFRRHRPEGHAIRDRLAAWATSVPESAWHAEPVMPPGVDDRDADKWEPLLAIADAAGGPWPERARVAAVALVAESRESAPSLGVRLLQDLRRVFGEKEGLPTKTILGKLNVLEEAPWGDLRGKPLNARGLANRLRPYGVNSRNVRVGEKVVKGYTSDLPPSFVPLSMLVDRP